MVLSSFSHKSVIHMMINMYVLWTFSTSIVSLLGKEQFLFWSYVLKTATGHLGPSLGAVSFLFQLLSFKSYLKADNKWIHWMLFGQCDV
ncbi:Presenilins-associated rhomboid-like protein, mitochondrial [Labeo rohita]|uniref:rhomboid protease n=1 Tax=Labeo rohita TaxID=84645 RepID=A0ABQ8LBY9_LABRO|nr:Presenilins-associated rhomboid-like protein, mitochondrial [Labeo rohita]